MYVRDFDFVSVSTFPRYDLGIVPTVWYYLFLNFIYAYSGDALACTNKSAKKIVLHFVVRLQINLYIN